MTGQERERAGTKENKGKIDERTRCRQRNGGSSLKQISVGGSNNTIWSASVLSDRSRQVGRPVILVSPEWRLRQQP
jgi:hypothetical protein